MIVRILLAATLALLVVILSAAGLGAFLWSRGTDRVADRILDRTETPEVDTAASVPAPVRRYLDRAIPTDAAPIRVARVEQAGEFLLNPPDGWARFTATELFTAHPAGMLWDATIRMAPLLGVRVRDSYTAGVGSMHGAVLGLFTVLEDSGPDRMAEASLVRYLAEAPWLPTRLLPAEGIEWAPVDDSTAMATLTDGGVTVSLEFRFTANGEIHTVYADRRFRGEAEDPQWAPWIGHFSDYASFDGFRVPTRGEVSWVIDGEERPYWRGRIEGVDYDF